MAGTEEMGKFMEMLTKAMASMAESERTKKDNNAERKIFDKDFLKEAKEYGGDIDAYNQWAFKVEDRDVTRE